MQSCLYDIEWRLTENQPGFEVGQPFLEISEILVYIHSFRAGTYGGGGGGGGGCVTGVQTPHLASGGGFMLVC